MKSVNELNETVSQVRRDIVRMVHACQSGHPGGSLGCADVVTTLYFREMKIDEEDDTFSSLFFTKANIDVKRSGNLVVLQLKNMGIMGFDFKTGKKLFEMDI